MKIKKINQSAGIVANVINSLDSNSSIDALSAAAGKSLREDYSTIVSPIQPTTGEKIWIRQSKNFFNAFELLKGYSSATIVELLINSVLISGVANSTVSQYISFRVFLPSDTYTLSRKWEKISGTTTSFSGAVVIQRTDTGAQIGAINANTTETTFTLEEDLEIAIYMYVDHKDFALTEATTVRFFDIQLEKNSVKSTYEETVIPSIYVKNDNDIYEEFIKKEIPLKTDFANTSGNIVKSVTRAFYKKCGHIYHINIGCNLTAITGGGTHTLFTTNLAPAETLELSNSVSSKSGRAYISPGGVISISIPAGMTVAEGDFLSISGTIII